MNPRAVTMYYALSIFVLGTALFVWQPSRATEVTSWQESITSQLSIAWQQTWTDQPVWENMSFVFEGVNEFYTQSANAFVDLTTDKESDAAIAYVFGQVYSDLSSAIRTAPASQIAGDFDIHTSAEQFMAQEPIYDIIPTGIVLHESEVLGTVLSAAKPSSDPVNLSHPWFTAKDAFTGQVYCMAIYNGEVNKYLGECKYDYN